MNLNFHLYCDFHLHSYFHGYFNFHLNFNLSLLKFIAALRGRGRRSGGGGTR